MFQTLNAQIFDIQHFSIHDGPGIRTTIFFKGCPLRCIWCHNPESQTASPQLSFVPSKCTFCRACENICPSNAHVFSENGVPHHNVNRSLCTVCGKCTSVCRTGALEISGKSMTIDEVFENVMRDSVFYQTSGGGVTISGGEPFMQFEFMFELLKKLSESKIHICIETCGYTSAEYIRKVARYTDLFLYDCKETSSELHKKYTGTDNSLIMQNLKLLDSMGCKIILRCPMIPQLNTRESHFEAIGDIAEKYANIIEINLEPYHPLGLSKSVNFGMNSEFKYSEFMDKNESEHFAETVRLHTSKKVIIL